MSETKEHAGSYGSSRDAIVARLYAALDRKMREIEERMDRSSRSGTETSTADSERDARTLTTLARLFEKLCDLEGQQLKRRGPADKEIDAGRLRSSIASRLEGMLEARDD